MTQSQAYRPNPKDARALCDGFQRATGRWSVRIVGEHSAWRCADAAAPSSKRMRSTTMAVGW
jgi:hypothetical protein